MGLLLVADEQLTIPINASGNDGDNARASDYNEWDTGATITTATANAWIAARKVRHSTFNFSEIIVGHLIFDTSAIPDNATITGATLRVKVDNIATSESRTLDLEWYDHGAAIDSSDYTANVGTTAGSVPASVWQAWPVETVQIVGLSSPTSVSKTGNTGIRMGISGGQPPSGAVYDTNLFLYSWDHATEPAPELVVTWTIPAGVALEQNIPDTLSLADSQRLDFGESVADTVSLADATSTESVSERTVSEPLPLTDSPSPSLGINRSQGDSVAATDGTPAFNFHLTGNETLVLTDNAVAQTGAVGTNFNRDVDDTVSLADERSFGFGKGLDDVAAPLDDSIATQEKRNEVGDTVSVADAQVFERSVSVSDSTSLSDAVSPASGVSFTLGDTIGVADAQGRDFATVSDSVTASDGSAAVNHRLTGAESSVSVTDSVSPVKSSGGTGIERSVSDTVSITDSGAMFSFEVSIAETDFQFVDAVSPSSGINRSVADTTLVSDLVARGVGLLFQETLALSDELSNAGTEFLVPLSDTLAVSDSLFRGMGLLLEEQLSIADGSVRQKNGAFVDDGPRRSRGVITIGRF